MPTRDYLLSYDELMREEALWEKTAYYVDYAEPLLELMSYGNVSVLEFGCATGWLPWQISKTMSFWKFAYTGVDANSMALKMAQQKYPHGTYLLADVRQVTPIAVDIGCAFAFMKHFRIEEWALVLSHVIGGARRGAFTTPLHEPTINDGTDYTHTRVSPAFLQDAVKRAGHEITERRMLRNEELLVVTRSV